MHPRLLACALTAAWLSALSPVPLLSAAAEPAWNAAWIWHPQDSYTGYNQTIIARRDFKLGPVRTASIRVTADSFYRLAINGRWVNDGPARGWPEHYQYDVLDVTPYLVDGRNEIKIIARYYGVGDFHRVPQQAGLLAQLDAGQTDGRHFTLGTDRTWQTAVMPAWLPDTPKVSIQMEPFEWYDARLEADARWKRAAELFAPHAAPWKGLEPRSVALLTRQPVAFKAFLGAKVVRADGVDYCLPASRLVNPGVIEANHTVSAACGMATFVEVDTATTLRLQSQGFKLAVDGQRNDANTFSLQPGRHLVLAFVADVVGHEKEKSLRIRDLANLRLTNPVQPGHANPWCFLRFPEYAFVTNDLRWIGFRDEDPRIAALVRGYSQESEALLTSVRDETTFRDKLSRRAEVLEARNMFVQDGSWQFFQRQVVGDAAGLVANPGGLIHNNARATVVQPSPQGDVELLYDLGEQDCGYYDLELVCAAGVIVDVNAVEYIAPDGRVQLSWGNRNGMRYVAREGANRFTSLKRRSGRYLFVTLRNLKSPAAIHRLQLIESTYPVEYNGSFNCSDTRLDEIWRISTRTLKLCMEDTFTDCPLYEQTHWVGDARNESLLAYSVFGAEDLARRCIQITAESLDRYPIAGCQTPSCWDTILPAWSFLWGISTWDYYWQTGDKEQLRAVFPRVIQNLQGAERFINDRDLFSGAFWNLFDWTGADQGPKTVVHNSQFMIGAIDAALRESEVLGDTEHVHWLKNLRARLVRGVNRLWDPAKGSYPDSVRDDGSISPSTCQHTSFLGLLYDVVEPANAEAAQRNLLAPPERMIRIGSPFAMLYLYETYEKLGLEDEIVKEIHRNYLPMVESGATTVWESFPTGTTGSDGWPTRSHCHAWSSAPTRFLNRIVLGVKTTSAGGQQVEISPRLNGLEWAHGTTATHAGPVRVAWKKSGNTLDVRFSTGPGMQAVFKRNDTHRGLQVIVNGKSLD